MNSYKGLNSKQVEESRIKHGSNVLTPPKRVHWLLLFLGKFKDPLIIILSIAAAISLTITLVFGKGSLLESAGIIIAIILATLVSFLNERKAGKEFDILNKVSDEDQVKVIRQKKNGNSRVMTIPKSEVVVGDYIIISEGDEIPADGIVCEAVNLKVDESSLNGESKPSSKRAEKVTDYKTAYSPNNLYRGTIVSEGEGVMLVENVGDKTEIGKTARAASEHTGVQTPLSRQLAKLGKQIGWVGIIISILVFVALMVYEWHRGIDFSSSEGINHIITMFMLAVTLIVMAVPEGLPMSISLALAYSMRKMTAQNALVRKMHACETMGAATVICTDKTGTLTQNKMKVAECTLPLTEETAQAISLNSTAFLDDEKYIGNPTEGAMLRFLSDSGFDYRSIRSEGEVLSRIPFSSSLKYMASAISQGKDKVTVVVKGSPEVILSFSDMEESARKAELEKISAFQKRGMRCISFAHKDCGSIGSLRNELCGMQYDGFIAIEDPVREDVPQAIAKCESAGIAIKIVTGDNSLTAIEIARQATLWKDTDIVERNSITGQEFAALSDEEAIGRIPDIKVMSRARPEDKVRLVKLLEKMGEVVAVTGDGTNDAPALNYANVGLSMGSGTAVAKESSDIIILDDSFSTVVTAVEWGRSIYHNIQRFIFFQLSVNVAALLTAIAGPLFLKEEYPLTITQILWINLIMDTLAALALASEPKDPAVMLEKPRKKGEPIVNNYIWSRILICGLGMFIAAFLYMIINNSEHDSVFLCSFFTGFVLMQWWNLLNARVLMTSHGPFHKLSANKNFILVFAFILILQIIIVEVFPGRLFRTTKLTETWWIWPALFAVTSLVLLIGLALRHIHLKKQQ
ncbi:MAG: calcium-translocating P-type ATPase, PMCA-type [Bacteroidales bacterium]|nr:calcium-translocating P-type ATPase, PMCA-type [Bacteroidales bacterium]